MSTIQDKHVSVVIKLDEFNLLNGKLSGSENGIQREKVIENFFLKKFSGGEGRLTLAQKPKKVKLTWYPSRQDASAEALHREAHELARQKSFKEATSRWIRAISLNPCEPDYFFNLGIAFFELKNYKEAIENLHRTLELCPIYLKAHLILGTIYLKIRKFQDAERHLRESILYYPNHALAYLNLGAVYSILKRYDDGIRMFQRTISLSPEEVRAHFGLAKIYSILGQAQKANQHYQRVIDINSNRQLTNHAKRAMTFTGRSQQTRVTPSEAMDSGETLSATDVEYFYQEGYSAYLSTDYKKAVEFYGGYLRHKPNDDFVWFSYGEAWLRAGDKEKALEAFYKALKLNPTKSLYHKEVAIVLHLLGQGAEVVKHITKARELGKDDSICNALSGIYALERKQPQEAVTDLQRAVSQNGSNLLARLNLARAYKELGETNNAINELYEIQKAASDSPIKQEAAGMLSSLGG